MSPVVCEPGRCCARRSAASCGAGKRDWSASVFLKIWKGSSYIVVTREATERHGRRDVGGSPLATALLRHLGNRRGRGGGRGDSGVAAGNRDGDGASSVGSAVGDSRRLFEAELDGLGATNRTAVVGGRGGTDGYGALPRVVSRGSVEARAASGDGYGGGDVGPAVHLGSLRLAILGSGSGGTNHDGGLRTRRNQRRACLLLRTGCGSIRRCCRSGRRLSRVVRLTRRGSHKGIG